MHTYLRALSLLAVLYVGFLPGLGVRAQIPATEEWVDIPVVVNIVDASDATNVDEAIKKANEILKQAKIRLIVKKTNRNVNIGDGDGDLTEAEGETAQEEGQKELEKTVGAGKGLKVTIADDCWTEDPNTAGWAVHRNPVVVVEPDVDVNEMGRTIAHEICHSLTIDYDLYDANDVNDLMYGYTDGGTELDPNQIKEIRKTAKARGTAYSITPRALPGRSVAIPISVDFSIDAHGAVLDDFNDVVVEDPFGLIIISPDDPSVQYADMREITLFGDEPLDPCSTITLEIQFGGPPPQFPVDSFLDVSLSVFVPGSELSNSIGTISIDVPAPFPPTAVWHDPAGGPDVNLPPPIIHENLKFDGKEPVVANESLEVTIPTELVALRLVGAEPIIVAVDSFTIDLRHGLESFLVIRDDALLFDFGLTQPCRCPALSAIPSGISGCGFMGELAIELDGRVIGNAMPKFDGTFTHFFGPTVGLEPGLHSVIAKELDDSGPSGAAHAIGFFTHCPVGQTRTDLDGDCDVDFGDFASLANDWLIGTDISDFIYDPNVIIIDPNVIIIDPNIIIIDPVF